MKRTEKIIEQELYLKEYLYPAAGERLMCMLGYECELANRIRKLVEEYNRLFES